jgi:hypothetical protein
MPLDSTTLSNSIVRIAPAKWGQTIKDYIAAKALKKQLDADARAADVQVKALRSQLVPALAGAPSAVCGHHLLTLTESKASAASLTLNNGAKIAWGDVTAVMVGGRKIPVDEIASLYGGRASSQDIVCAVA